MANDFSRLALRVAAKDLRLFFRDRVGMALGFLLPIVLVAIFGGIFGSMGGDDGSALPKQRVRVADLDGSEASKAFVEALRVTGLLEPDLGKATEAWTRDALLESVRKGRVAVALVIPSGFGQRLGAEEMPSLELIRDPARDVERQIASQAVFAALMQSHGERIGRARARSGIAEMGKSFGLDAAQTERLQELAAASLSGTASAPSSVVELRDTVAVGATEARGAERRTGMVTQSVAGTAVMMLLFGLVACGGTLLREREQGTLRRLLLTPAPSGAILAGKFLFTFVTGMMQIVIMFAFGALVFDLPIARHAPGLVVVSAALCAAATGFGVFIATVGKTQRQVEGISTLIILVMSALGGSWFPLFLMPQWMQVAGHFTLNAWAMDAYQDLFWRNLPVTEVLPEVGVLLGVAAALSALAAFFFRRRFTGSGGQ